MGLVVVVVFGGLMVLAVRSQRERERERAVTALGFFSRGVSKKIHLK